MFSLPKRSIGSMFLAKNERYLLFLYLNIHVISSAFSFLVVIVTCSKKRAKNHILNWIIILNKKIANIVAIYFMSPLRMPKTFLNSSTFLRWILVTRKLNFMSISSLVGCIQITNFLFFLMEIGVADSILKSTQSIKLIIAIGKYQL